MEEILYKWIFIAKETGKYLMSHNSIQTPRNGDPKRTEWIEWNKPLPEDIDTLQYKYNAETSELESN